MFIDKIIEILKAMLFGIVEGITEWLPVSSTGHIILLDEFIKLYVSDDAIFRKEFADMFEMVIQFGAIIAVAVIYFTKLNPFSGKKSELERKSTWILWGKVVVACIPAGVLGVLAKLTGLDDLIGGYAVIAGALIIYGIAFIVIEKFHKTKSKVERVEDITLLQALAIGGFQMLSVVPGTSRSGSTILGARLIGVSRPAAAEFSFFLGIPVIAGASLINAYGFIDYVAESNVSIPPIAIIVLLVATVVSFVVSMLTVRFLVDFVKKHSFIPFGIYRIILGVVVLIYFGILAKI